MSPRLGGALLVLVAASAAVTGRHLQVHFVAAAAIWLACLRRPASARLVFVVALAARAAFALSDYVTDDTYRYVWEGRIQWEGESPYAHAPDDAALAHLRGPEHDRINHPGYSTIYPPLAQLLFVAATGLGAGEAGLRLAILALDVAVVGILLGWLRATGRPARWAMLYAWCPLAVAAAGSGHLDPLMLACLGACGWAWERGRPRTAAALLGGAILAKTVAVICVPWFVLRHPRAALGVLAPVVLLGYLPYLGGDLFGPLYSFGADFAFNGSLFQVAAWLAPGVARPAMAALLILWVAAVAVTEPRIARAFVLLFAGLLLLSPTVHFWYLTWFLVALPAVGPRRWVFPLIVWTVSVAFSSATYQTHHGGAAFVEFMPFTLLEYALPAACAAWLFWRAWPRRAPLAPASGSAAPSGRRYAVVIPCRGEAESLRALLPRWLETDAERVIVADTPTGDGTRALTRASPRLVYVAVDRRGYGAAVQAALEAVGEVDFAVVCDADHSLGPTQVDALLAPFADPGVGLVTAARTDARGLSLPQRAGNALAAFLIALGWGRRFHDIGPFRALRLRRWPPGALTDPGFGWNVEMNVRALELGQRVVEVGLPASERAHGRNEISGTLSGVLRAGYGILRQLYRLRERSCRQPSSS